MTATAIFPMVTRSTQMKLPVVTNILTLNRVPVFSQLAERVNDCMMFLMAEQEEYRQWQFGLVTFHTFGRE